MTKYILIQNDGEIETNSFELIGASTKRNDNTKIGFFGSGLKYSIAYMMRNGIKFRIFSGNTEVLFTTVSDTLKGQNFDRICINGNVTSFTVTMGPTWKEDWFVLREIYCNALDESGCQIIKETHDINPSEGKTRIYIEQTDKLKELCDNWDSYFSDEREPLFETENIYTSSLGSGDFDGSTEQKVRVFSKTNGVLFRKGIRVYDNKNLMYDYGVEFVAINEDRTASSAYALDYCLCSIVAAMPDEEYVKNVLRSALDDITSKEYSSLVDGTSSTKYSDKWIKFSEENMLVVKEKSGKYTEQIGRTQKEVFYLPQIFCRNLKKKHPSINILGMGALLGDISFDEVEPNSKMQYLINEVKKSLEEMKYEISYDIIVADIHNDTVLGLADKQNKRIIIGTRTFDMGRREIAMTMMEENEHLISGHGDESRAFQTHIFSQWLKTMENTNGLFL